MGKNDKEWGDVERKGMHSCCVILCPSPTPSQVLSGGDTLGKGRGFGSRDVFKSEREQNLFFGKLE